MIQICFYFESNSIGSLWKSKYEIPIRDPKNFRSACSRHISCGFTWQIHFSKTIFRFIAKPGCSTMSKLLHKWVLWSNFDVLLHPGFTINQKMILVKCILRQKNYLMLRLQADLWLWPKIWGALVYTLIWLFCEIFKGRLQKAKNKRKRS